MPKSNEELLPDEDLIALAMAQMDEELPTETNLDPGMSLVTEIDPNKSQTLEYLEREATDRLPPDITACAQCPVSMWQATSSQVQCYCRVMHVITWTSTKKDEVLTHCDGMFFTPK